jgi:hypothetical protein
MQSVDWVEIEELSEDVAEILDLLTSRRRGRGGEDETEQVVSIRQLRNELQYSKALKLLLKGREGMNGLLDRLTLSNTIETLEWSLSSTLNFDGLFTLTRAVKLHWHAITISERIFNCLDIQECSLVDRDTWMRLLLGLPEVSVLTLLVSTIQYVAH